MAVWTNHGTGIQDAVAADFHMIAQHSTDFQKAGGNVAFFVVDNHQTLVGLDVGCYASCPHMRFVTQDTVSYIVEMGYLHMVKEDYIFEFYRISHHAVVSHQSGLPDKGAMANFGVGTDNAGGT